MPFISIAFLAKPFLLDKQPTKAEGLIQNATSYDTIDASEAQSSLQFGSPSGSP